MGLVRGKDTRPELTVRRVAHGLGFRFRLHVSRLPGHPDLVFPGRRKVILVHGCFWHRHRRCKKSTTPKSRVRTWQRKFEDNIRRDTKIISELRKAGWDTLVIWECETRRSAKLRSRIRTFLQ